MLVNHLLYHFYLIQGHMHLVIKNLLGYFFKLSLLNFNINLVVVSYTFNLHV